MVKFRDCGGFRGIYIESIAIWSKGEGELININQGKLKWFVRYSWIVLMPYSFFWVYWFKSSRQLTIIDVMLTWKCFKMLRLGRKVKTRFKLRNWRPPSIPPYPRNTGCVAEKRLYQGLAVNPLGPRPSDYGGCLNYRSPDFGSGVGTALPVVGLYSFPCG